MSPLTLLAGVLLLASGPALAQEALPSAGGAGVHGAPASAIPPGDLDPPQDIVAEDPGPIMGPCGPSAADRSHPDRADRKAHGEVFAGVGTNGYREAGGVVCQPLGDHSAVTIAVDAGRIDGWRRRR